MKKIILLIGIILSFTTFSWAQNDDTWIDLDGTNDFLDFGTDNILAGKSQFTVEMRIHFDLSTGDYTIIGQRNSDANRTLVLQRWAGAFYVFLSNSNWGTCSFIPCEATYYHIAIVFDGSGATNSDRLKLYINGVMQTLTFNGTIDNTSWITSPPANLVLGCEHNGPSTQLQFVNGQFGEFCIWDRPLNSSEIASRMLSETNGTETGLLEFFHFNNGIPGGNNTSITSFTGGMGVCTITPMNMTMNGSSSNFVGPPSLASPVDVSVNVSGTTITANATGATYQWLNCDNGYSVIAGATFQNYTPLASGNYAVQVTQGSCYDTSACTYINILGINSVQNSNLNIYPNPVKDQLVIENNGIEKNLSIEIFNSTGEIVLHQLLFDQTILKTNELPSGIYLVKIVSVNNIILKKIIKN
jgi:hypothetical protein